MKIRNILSLSALTLGVAAMFSCTEIDEKERLIEAPLQPEEIVRNVLVEDFTGQECVNCPLAHEIIEGLQEQYGSEHLVAVAIHGGGMAVHQDDRPYGLANDLGEEYNRFWGVDEWPKGMVNRSSLLSYTSWTTKIVDDYTKYTPLDIDVTTTYNDADRSLQIEVKTASEAYVAGKLQLWITEDDIEAMQLMPNSSRNRTYIHNNVLRAAVNGTWGTDFEVSRNSTTQETFTYKVDEDWEAENLAIVAFVYNTDGVVQVVRKPLKDNTTEE